jgi:hypothetical protein
VTAVEPNWVESTDAALEQWMVAQVRRSIRNVLVLRAGAFPALVLLGIGIGYMELGDLDDIGLGWLVFPLIALVLLVRLLRMGYWLRQSFKGEGMLVLTGEVLHAGEVDFEKTFVRVADIQARWLYVDVRERIVIDRDSRAVRAPGGIVSVSVPRRIYRRAKPRDDVTLACTAGERAIARLDTPRQRRS